MAIHHNSYMYVMVDGLHAYIQGSTGTSSGARVKLDVSELASYSLFPGQVRGCSLKYIWLVVISKYILAYPGAYRYLFLYL